MSPLDSRALASDADFFDLGGMRMAFENDALPARGWRAQGSVSAAEAALRGGKNFV